MEELSPFYPHESAFAYMKYFFSKPALKIILNRHIDIPRRTIFYRGVYMRRWRCSALLLVTMVLLVSSFPVITSADSLGLPKGIFADGASESGPLFAPGVILVQAVEQTYSADSLVSAHTSIGASVQRDFSAEGKTGLQLVLLPPDMQIADAVDYYSSVPGVRYAEPDYFRGNWIIPDDPDLWRQWGLSNSGQIFKEGTSPGTPGADIKATQGWNTITNSSVIVAVLDSGVDYLHPDLDANIWRDPVTGNRGYDAITGEPEPMDLASHGTHCAGIIGAVGNNSIGVSGVSWNATILPVRFLNSFGTGTVSDEIAAILWADRFGAKVFSCSYGGTGFSQAEYDVISGTDALFICAAGNSGLDNDSNPHYPSSLDLPNILAVAATDPNDNLASFSNYGKTSVDLGAPGVDIYSTKHNLYAPDPLWRDSFESFSNWTIHGNWTLDTEYYISPPNSALGFVNKTSPDSTDVPAILSIREPLNLTGLSNPILSYQLQIVGLNYSFIIQGSSDNRTWQNLEYDRKPFTILPFLYRECKIPNELRDGPLYIRFIADGDFISCFIDDITLSDGYGTLIQTNYGYISGTSMAAPYVSGIVSLMMTYAPDKPLSTIKDTLLTSTDPLETLMNKTTTGGKANLSAALYQIKKPEKDQIELSPGWNHVSVAKRLSAGYNTADEVFGKVTNTSGHSILTYSNASWNTIQANETISPLSSYWIWTETPETVSLVPDPDQKGMYGKLLNQGWNGFGVLGTEVHSAKSRMSPVSENWTYIIGFDAPGQKYEEPIIRDGTGSYSDSRFLTPYQGYWLYMTDTVTYQISQ